MKPRKKREKAAVIAEISALERLRGSEEYALFTKLIRDKLSMEINSLLTATLMPSEILPIVDSCRAHYQMLRMVPGEVISIEEELARLEREEDHEMGEYKHAIRTGGAI